MAFPRVRNAHAKACMQELIGKMINNRAGDFSDDMVRLCKEYSEESVFLISYDLIKNHPQVKAYLLDKENKLRYHDKINEKNLPETTIIWVGKSEDTEKTALDEFIKNILKPIKQHNLPTDFDKVIVVEILTKKVTIIS